ncbi:MAG: hypothetical protein EOP09_14130 [Proteobacteria bacterium]|nr:MAG: hypothetical protein EOP09_14130 [Pseudomonadota bacterium]
MTACSYTPEDPGQCKLQCSKAIIVGNEPVVTMKLKSAVPATMCGPKNLESEEARRVPLRADFLVGESILDQAGEEISVRPIPNISVEPVIIGATAPGINSETSPNYQGIQTPRNNWCSDACGVVSISVVGRCPEIDNASDVTVQLHSGAVYSDPATFSIETKDPEE